MFEGLKRMVFSAPRAAPRSSGVSDRVGTQSPPTATGETPQATTEGADAVIIDVRSEREFNATAIAEAINLPLPQVAHRIGELVPDRGTPLVLYCASGARSGMACMMLRQMGYARVTNAGGLYAAAAQLRREIRR